MLFSSNFTSYIPFDNFLALSFISSIGLDIFLDIKYATNTDKTQVKKETKSNCFFRILTVESTGISEA